MEKDILRSMIYFGKNRSTATVRKEDIMNVARTYGYSYPYVKSCIEIMLTCNYNMDITDNIHTSKEFIIVNYILLECFNISILFFRLS